MQPISLPAVDALRATLVDVAPHVATLSVADRGLLLRGVVYAAVDALRGTGLSSAQVEAVVLSLVNDEWSAQAGGNSVDDIRAWCIQRYFAPTPRESAENESRS